MIKLDITIPAIGDVDQAAHDAIETAAEGFTSQGFQPDDSEPGEWLILRKEDGESVMITVLLEEPPPSVVLDPGSNDPDGRGDRTVPLADCFTVRLPKAFYDDHVARDLIAGNIERETTRHYVVLMDEVVALELISDGECMIQYAAMGEYGPESIGLMASVKASVKTLKATLRERAMSGLELA